MPPDAEAHLTAMWPSARLVPLGDRHLLVRFSDQLSEPANRAAVAFAERLRSAAPTGVLEIVPNLVSVLLRYEPLLLDQVKLAGEVGLLLSSRYPGEEPFHAAHQIHVSFGGDAGPDLESVAIATGLEPEAFVAAHNAQTLRALAVGFAPGFVYCGFHPHQLQIPRRTSIRPSVPAGSILFAAGQTAIAATEIPTGWHLIGRTEFRNFDSTGAPPVRIVPGDTIRFETRP